MRIDISDRPQRLVPVTTAKFDANWGGQFFAEVVSLKAGGDYTAKIQIIFSEHSRGEAITIRIKSLSRHETLAETELPADLSDRRKADAILLSFSLADGDDIEIAGHCEANCATHVLRFITIIDGDGSDLRRFDFDDIGIPRIADISVVNFGTTGVCNASCMHCPTNKDIRKALPHGRMKLDLFRKIIAELKANDFSGEIRFGLFAEPLDDPLLRERLEIIKQELPRTSISIATNAGLFDVKKHGFILDYATFIGVHVESVDPEVYNAYMEPLKADRVIPRILSLLELAVSKGKTNSVGITTPVHKGNIAGLPKLYDFFSKYKSYIELTAVSNRCWEEGPYTQISLAPVGGLCAPGALHSDIFIDWDGALLPCCFDFSKSMILGDLNKQTLRQIFRGEAWQAMYGTFQRKGWSEKEACSRCRVDHASTIKNYIAPFITVAMEEKEFAPVAFSFTERAQRDPDGSIVSLAHTADGNVIFGPYVLLPAGRYRVHSRISVESFSQGLSYLEFDVNADKIGPIAEGGVEINSTGPIACSLEFTLERDTMLEFRVRKAGPIVFRHTGAVVVNLGSYEAPKTAAPATRFYDESAAEPAVREDYPAAAFSLSEGMVLTEDDCNVSDLNVADGNIIFGPYVQLPAGHYRVRPRIDVQEFLPGARIDVDVNVDWHTKPAARRIEISRVGPIICTLDFDLEHESTVEFRVSKYGPVCLRHRGTSLWFIDQFAEPKEAAPDVTEDVPVASLDEEPAEPSEPTEPSEPAEASESAEAAGVSEAAEAGPRDIIEDEPAQRADDVSRSREKRIPPHSFSVTNAALRDMEGNIVSEPQVSDGNVVYGPYVPVPAGRYRVQPDIEVQELLAGSASLRLDVYAADKDTVLAIKRVKISEKGPLSCVLDFALAAEAVLEFRLNKKGRVGLKYSGATLHCIGDDEPLNYSGLANGNGIRQIADQWLRRIGL